MNSKENGKSFIHNSIVVSLMVGFGKLLGFLKQVVIAWAFGANAITDVFFTADSYIALFGGVQIASISPSVLTEYIRLREKNKKEVINSLITICYLFFSLVSIGIILANILFIGRISSWLGISYSSDQLRSLQWLLMALCPVILFTSLSGVSQGVLDGNQRFVPSKLLSLFFSFSIILFTIAFHKTMGIKALLIGFLVGYGSHTIYVLTLSKQYYNYSYNFSCSKASFTTVVKNVFPLVIGNSLMDLGHMVDKIIASSLIAGSVSYLYYGQVISSDLVNSVIISSIGTVLLPSLTNKISKGTSGIEIAAEISQLLIILIYILAFITGIYILAGSDLVKLFFERGSFTSESTRYVSNIAICYASGFVFTAVREVFAKVHYAYQDTVSPMRNGIIGVFLNVILSIILSKFMGVIGIAIATSVSMMVVAGLMTFSIERHIKKYPLLSGFWINLGKTGIALLVMVCMGVFIKGFLINSPIILRAIIICLFTIIIYSGTSIALKHTAIEMIRQYFKHRI